MNFKRSLHFSAVLFFLSVTFVFNSYGQQRARVVTPNSQTVQTNPPELVKTTVSSRPVNRQPLTNNIVVVGQPKATSLVKRTVEEKPINSVVKRSSVGSPTAKTMYPAITTSLMLNSIQSLYGIPYRYGSTGPNRYDCSGFVWTVFQRSGISFERSSAANYWQNFEPVDGDERFKFGTLVFFNRLGHVGIVADENGFYHASSSKGITYSPFKGYWEKRVVGFRRIPAQNE